MRAKDPIYFPENSVVRDKFTNEVFVIEQHKNGMSVLRNLTTGFYSKWNSYNNQRFIPANFVSLGVQILCYAK